MSDDAQSGRQLTREEFLRQMGLAPDDLLEVPRGSQTPLKAALPSHNSVVDPTPPSRPAGDAPAIIHEDEWVRTTVFADKSLMTSTEDDVAAKKAIMQSYKASKSIGGSTYNESNAGDEKKASELVTDEDHRMASDYKNELLEQFRKRKQKGETRSPPEVSPPRRRVDDTA